jgi:hypothetical protein
VERLSVCAADVVEAWQVGFGGVGPVIVSSGQVRVRPIEEVSAALRISR